MTTPDDDDPWLKPPEWEAQPGQGWPRWQFDSGYISPYFVTNEDRQAAVLDEPCILIHDQKLSGVQPILPLLETVVQSSRSLLIIAEDVDGEAMATLVVNKLRGSLKVAAVKAPSLGDYRKVMLQDIAILTGGQLISEDIGVKLWNVTLAELGSAKRVVIEKDRTTIIAGGARRIRKAVVRRLWPQTAAGDGGAIAAEISDATKPATAAMPADEPPFSIPALDTTTVLPAVNEAAAPKPRANQWLSVWEAIALIAFGRTNIADPDRGLHTAPPWGDSFKERWGFRLGTESDERQAWPVGDLRIVFDRVTWWRNRDRRLGVRQSCPLPALPHQARAAVRAILNRHGKRAPVLLQELQTDIHTELAQEADFVARRKSAQVELFGAASAGRILFWGCRGRIHEEHHSADREVIPAHFFARPERMVILHNWISESVGGIGFGNIAINHSDVLRLQSPTGMGESTNESASPIPTGHMTNGTMTSRPRPTRGAVQDWMRHRVATWPDHLSAPSEAADWAAASRHFGDGLRRDEDFRPIRSREVPPEWQKQGRRKPWGQAKNSAVKSAKLRPQN